MSNNLTRIAQAVSKKGQLEPESQEFMKDTPWFELVSQTVDKAAQDLDRTDSKAKVYIKRILEDYLKGSPKDTEPEEWAEVAGSHITYDLGIDDTKMESRHMLKARLAFFAKTVRGEINRSARPVSDMV